MLNKPIFILGSHKSGTSLLRSLFDGHSEIFTNPIETHFFDLFGEWVDYDYRRQKPEEVSIEKIKTLLNKYIRYVEKRDNPMAGFQGKDLFDMDRFNEILSELTNESSRQDIIQTYFKATYYSIYGKHLPTDKRIVHKAVGLGEFALELHQLFPDAKFVHIIRNPYSNLVSFRKFHSKTTKFPLINRLINSLNNNYFYLYKNSQLIDNYHVLKYEDLVTQPDKEIGKLCQFLELKPEEALYTPTTIGETWKGNSTTGKKFKGIENKYLEVWKEEIHPLEVYYVNNNFDHILRDFEYSHFEKKGSKLMPIKNEGLIRYLYNRVYVGYNRYYNNKVFAMSNPTN